jgi:hypothetical protein
LEVHSRKLTTNAAIRINKVVINSVSLLPRLHDVKASRCQGVKMPSRQDAKIGIRCLKGKCIGTERTPIVKYEHTRSSVSKLAICSSAGANAVAPSAPTALLNWRSHIDSPPHIRLRTALDAFYLLIQRPTQSKESDKEMKKANGVLNRVIQSEDLGGGGRICEGGGV